MIVVWIIDVENMVMDDVEFVWCKYIKLKYYFIWEMIKIKIKIGLIN